MSQLPDPTSKAERVDGGDLVAVGVVLGRGRVALGVGDGDRAAVGVVGGGRDQGAHAGGGRLDVELDAPREPPDPKGLDFGPR